MTPLSRHACAWKNQRSSLGTLDTIWCSGWHNVPCHAWSMTDHPQRSSQLGLARGPQFHVLAEVPDAGRLPTRGGGGPHYHAEREGGRARRRVECRARQARRGRLHAGRDIDVLVTMRSRHNLAGEDDGYSGACVELISRFLRWNESSNNCVSPPL